MQDSIHLSISIRNFLNLDIYSSIFRIFKTQHFLVTSFKTLLSLFHITSFGLIPWAPFFGFNVNFNLIFDLVFWENLEKSIPKTAKIQTEVWSFQSADFTGERFQQNSTLELSVAQLSSERHWEKVSVASQPGRWISKVNKCNF